MFLYQFSTEYATSVHTANKESADFIVQPRKEATGAVFECVTPYINPIKLVGKVFHYVLRLSQAEDYVFALLEIPVH